MIKIIQDKSIFQPEVIEAFNRAEVFPDGSPRCVVVPVAEVKYAASSVISSFARRWMIVHYLVGPKAGQQEMFSTPEFLREFGRH